MAKWTWAGGKDIGVIQRQVKLHVQENYKDPMLEALAISVEEGAVLTQDLLELAITPTGLRREARGGQAGRHDSGNMVGSISYDEYDSKWKRAKRVIAHFGWFAGEFEQYFKDQDLGEGNIPAARALPTAYEFALQALRSRLKVIARGKSGR